AIESLAGDIFQLGNSSYRVLKLETTVMRVEDAKGLPPSIPFWIGEAPGRTHELSLAISDMKNKLTQHFSQQDWSGAKQWCRQELGLNYSASEQLVDYLATGYASFDALPTHSTLIMERFFDEAGDMHLVIHSPFGSRMNRAWGLALRKRFCRKFNFELQAAATEDAIILSLGATHSFPLIEVSHYLNRQTVRDILVQALLDAPMFKIRWRWNASIALAVLRFRGGKRIPPQLQRMDAEDLVSVIFPDQLACLENIAGDREVPDHPLVKQTIQDCLHEAMDIEALEELLLKMKEGQIRVIAQDLVEPSILAREILTAQPYAFLDDAPAEERRTRAVMARRWVSPQSASELGSLDPAAIDKVIKEAWPQCNTVDELHDALMILGSFTPLELANTGQGYELMAALVEQGRALRIEFGNENRSEAWIATERLCQWQSVHPALNQSSPVEIPDRYRKTWPEDEAIREIVRSRLSGLGPVRTEQLAQCLAVEENKILQALLYLEGEGYAMRGCFTPATQVEEWCDRTLLARIHRYTLNSLRREIEPVSAQDFMRFLFYWQGLDENTIRQGESGLLAVLSQLEGYEAAAAAWEGKILKLRIENYSPDMLDRLSMSGRIGWQRRTVSSAVKGGILKQSSICFVERKNMGLWRVEDDTLAEGDLSSLSALVYKNLVDKGALFFADLVEVCGLLEMQVEEALEDLSSKGMVSSDSFAGVRVMIRSKKTLRRRNRRAMVSTMDDAGRWVPLKPLSSTSLWTQEKIDHIAMVLLKRYGVVFKRVIERESHLPPWRELLLCYRRMES
ncbi:MAG: ATP-dependent DNA helicase, partial [Gammaproteobacteria bacterium]|nr:ATP-dependent DNA helicase [Gammaproteobacteria bacterium]